MRKSTLDELDNSFQSETFRRRQKKMNVIGHDDEGMQQKFTFSAIPIHCLAEHISHAFRLEEILFAERAGSDEVGCAAGLASMGDCHDLPQRLKAAGHKGTLTAPLKRCSTHYQGSSDFVAVTDNLSRSEFSNQAPAWGLSSVAQLGRAEHRWLEHRWVEHRWMEPPLDAAPLGGALFSSTLNRQAIWAEHRWVEHRFSCTLNRQPFGVEHRWGGAPLQLYLKPPAFWVEHRWVEHRFSGALNDALAPRL